MKRLYYLLAISVGLVVGGTPNVGAISKAMPLVPAFEGTDEVLMANRLRNRGLRFRVRSSRYRRGGFSRGSCPKGSEAVVPASENSEKAPSYLTASTHPTFFIKVPELPNATGVIHIQDDDLPGRNPKVYTAAFDLTGQAGIVGIQMPDDAPALEEGSDYEWSVVIDCNPSDDDVNTIVFSGAEIERVADVEGTPEEQLDYYLQAGIWQETTAILAEYRRSEATAAADEDWAVLMEESGRPEFSATPVVAIIDSRLSDE